MSVEIDSVSKAIVDIDMVSMGIGDLRKQYSGVIYEVSTFSGLEKAKAARQAIRTPRYEVEKIRKEAKKPLLEIGKKLDAEAARITKALLEIEEPIDKQIKEQEALKEREKQAKIDAEIKRVSDLQERVAELRGNQLLSPGSGSALISEHLAELEAISVDESFEEFLQQAKDAKEAGLSRLRKLHEAAIEHEAEQARIKAEREELARLKAEQVQREASERKEREALAMAQREELRKQREAQDAETARIRAEQETAARAERERIAEENRRLAAERAEFERQQAEARKAREAEERQRSEQARIAAVKQPSEEELLEVVSEHYRVPTSKALTWLRAYNWKKALAA